MTTQRRESVLVLARADRPLTAAVGLMRGWLLVGSDEDALVHFGPYAGRARPAKAAHGDGASAVLWSSAEAMAGPVNRRLLAWWGEAMGWLTARDDEQRARHGGSAPDFGDPRPVLNAVDAAVRRRIAFAAKAAEASVQLDVGADDVRVDLAVTAGAGDSEGAAWLASMPAGDVAPLGQVPADALAAWTSRDAPDARAADAHAPEGTLEESLGTRATSDDLRKLRAALDAWARTRGETMTVSVAWGDKKGVTLQTPAVDAEAAIAAVEALAEATRMGALRGPLAEWFHMAPAPRTHVDVPALGSVSFLPMRPTGPGAAARGPAGLAWAVQTGALWVAVGEDAPGLLASRASPGRRLGDDPLTARELAALQADATFALVAHPLELDAARHPAAAAPLVMAWGKRSGAAWLHLGLGDVLVRELVRVETGL